MENLTSKIFPNMKIQIFTLILVWLNRFSTELTSLVSLSFSELFIDSSVVP
jgi:hypothetical protein